MNHLNTLENFKSFFEYYFLDDFEKLDFDNYHEYSRIKDLERFLDNKFPEYFLLDACVKNPVSERKNKHGFLESAGFLFNEDTNFYIFLYTIGYSEILWKQFNKSFYIIFLSSKKTSKLIWRTLCFWWISSSKR